MPTKLNHHQIGKGSIIVLLHGYLSSSQYFKSLRKRLSKDHKVISVDLLGHGKSLHKKIDDYSLNTQIDALTHTLNDLVGDEKITILGHSMGGLIATGYAQRYPEKVNRLLLVNPPMFIDYDQAKESIAGTGRAYRLMLFSKYRRVFWAILKLMPRFMTRFRSRLSMVDFLRVPKKAREQSLHEVIMQTNIIEELDKITIPTLVIIGERDRSIYMENYKYWNIPEHVTVRINRHGHQFTTFHTNKAEQTIRDFTQ